MTERAGNRGLAEVHELCRLRTTLEAFAASSLFKTERKEVLFEELRQCCAAMYRAAVAGDYPAFHRHDMAFHQTLVEAAHLAAAVECWRLVAGQLDSWLQEVKEQYWPNLMTLHQEHQLLLEALCSPFQWVRENALHQHLEAGWYRIEQACGEGSKEGDPVAKADAFLSTHFASRFEMGFVAGNVSFISLSHLNRLFRERFGISPYARLRQIRLNRAAELLISSQAEIASVARQVGYRNVSHFSRDFRSLYRTTPARYRKAGLSALQCSVSTFATTQSGQM